MSRRRDWRTSAAPARWRSLPAEGYAINSAVKNGTAETEQPQYNPYTKRYEYAPKGATLQYNPYRKQRELVGPGETLQYNPYTKKREYAPEGAMPRYNPYTKQRE